MSSRILCLGLMAAFAISIASISDFAIAKPHGTACKTLACVSCRKQCYNTYYQERTGPNFNPTTSPIYKRQYNECNKKCLSK
jgi:hypothetical protein